MKIPSFSLRGFRQPREVLGQALGKLEREVMDMIWKHGEISVREVYRAFDERIAYTTLMTTLQRLHKKGVLKCRKQGRAFFYAPLVSPAEFEQGIAKDVIAGMMSRSTDAVEPLLACIVDAVSERDREYLDALDRLIQEKKQESRRKP